MSRPNRKLRRDYDLIYREDPLAANVFLLLTELADDQGQINFGTLCLEQEIQRLMRARFDDPLAYQLSWGEKT